MTGDTSWDDDDDAFIAHDLGYTGDGDNASALASFDGYAPAAGDGADDGWGLVDPLASDEEAGEILMALFTVTNPAGTVSATATLGGRLQQIDLSANVVAMTESQLADEITVLAGLAAQKAQAAQHTVTVELMRTMGHDRVMTSGFLEYTLGLPSPEAVDAHAARVFAARYPLPGD
jgi:ESX secretion-associated protein EspD/H